MASAPEPPGVAILGAGGVGRALLARLLPPVGSGPVGSASLPGGRGFLELTGVLVRDIDRPRDEVVSRFPLTTDARALVDSSQVVVELMGGIEPATSLMLRALEAGKRVVTANKAALAERWDDFLPYLEQGRLYFEAAVMSGTPVIGPLAGSLRGSTPLELHAILNGTTSYILGRLEAGDDFAPALADAQRLGFAEADPTLDIGGIDAAHKLALLARLAFDPGLDWPQVLANTHGIEHLTPAIVHEAMEDGGTVRLVGSIQPNGGRWQARVRAVYLPAGHPLTIASESGNEVGNALLLRSRELGEVVIQGPGAGGSATAAAVLADLQAALSGRPGPALLPSAVPVPTDHAGEDLGELLKA